jgi:isopropylmalate/homocitrate/citramalate synthase
MNHQDDKDEDQDQDIPQGLTDIEESAFYESGLTAHGCIDNLDSYAMESIKRYGRILFKSAYKDATTFKAYKDYTGLMLDSNRLKEELAEIKERCEKLEKAMKYSPSGESLLSKFIQATQDVHEAKKRL